MGVLILLVVFSHAIGPLGGQPKEVLNQWLFMFHMPVFVFLSGYLTRRSSTWSPRLLALRLLVPFAIFQVVHVLTAPLETGEFNYSNPLVAEWTTWYLLSLFFWRLAAPWLARLPALVPATIVVSLAAGLVPAIGPEISLARTLGFLPFFALGLAWQESWFAQLRSISGRFAGAGAFAVAAILAFLTEEHISRTVYYFHEDYLDLGLDNLQGLILRGGILGMAMMLTLAFVALTGWRSQFLARIGAASLVVYLLHPIALYAVRHFGFSDAIPDLAWLGIVAVGTVMFGWLVTLPKAVQITRPLMDYRWWSQRLTHS